MARGGVRLALVSLVALFGIACGSSPGKIPTCTVGGTVSGLSGTPTALVIQNDGGDDLTITANGSFTFPTSVGRGETFQVTVKSQPTCPGYTCTVSGGTGTAIASVTSVSIDCALNSKVTLFAANFGTPTASIYATDNVGGLSSTDPIPSRELAYSSASHDFGGFDSLAIDRARDLAYVSDRIGNQIAVIANLSSATGDLTPARTIVLQLSSNPKGMALDPGPHDRLYVATAYGLMIFAGASSTSGSPTPTALIPATTSFAPSALALDTKQDRLFVASYTTDEISVFDAASTLTSSSVPSRTLALPNELPAAISVDTCSDRLYVGIGYLTPPASDDGAVLIFNGAGTLHGTLGTDVTPAATISSASAIGGIAIDDGDRLYTTLDVTPSTAVIIYEGASALSGSVSTAGKAVSGAVSSAYGLDFISHP
jgi:hypothetical protein